MSGWTATLLPEAAVELGAMAADIRARFGRMVGLIETHGLEKVREPHVRHLKGSLWEMRMTGWDGIARAIYVTAHDQARGRGPGIFEKDAEDSSA